MNQALPVAGGRPPLFFRLTQDEVNYPQNALPPGTLLESTLGALLSDSTVTGPTTAGDFSFTVTVQDANGATSTGTMSLHVNAAPVIEDVDFSDWTEGRPYARTFTGTFGTPPYTWTLHSGTLPVTGTLNAGTGRISGNVLPAGDYTFTVQVEDLRGSKTTRQFAMHANPVPTITTDSLPLALVERAFAGKLDSTGGTGERRYFLTGEGFELDGFTGGLRGTPLLAKDFSFEVRVTDDTGASSRKHIPLTVVPFYSLREKKNVLLDTFGPGATTGEVRRFVELLAGSRLDGTFRLVGKGTLGAHLRLVDADTGEEVDLAPFVKTKGARSTLKNFVVDTTRRFYVIVTPDPEFAGTVETSLRATPRLAWSGRVAVDPVGAAVPVTVHALGGTYLTVTTKRARKSASLPTIASVTDEAGNELLDLFELRVTKTGATLRMAKSVPLGAVTIHLAGRPEGGAGDADWTVSMKSPKEYDVQLYDKPAVDDRP
jgi:hypothetical protein